MVKINNNKKCGYRGCNNNIVERKKYCSDVHKYREVQCRKEFTKGWGNKNSQIRLNKIIKRYGKRSRKYNVARF